MTSFIWRKSMCQVNVLEAKTNFSRLLSMLENKEEDEIIICKNNNPVAKLCLVPKVDISSRIGIAKGKIFIPDLEEFNSVDSEITSDFLGI